jgi:hypothetical protein
MGLEIFRENATEERVTMIAGRNKKWQANKFTSESLRGAVRMIVDDRSLIRKSHATQRATIAQLIQLGVINPQDPEQQYKVLQAFGETGLKGSTSADADEAQKEWEQFLAGEMPRLIPLVQNSQAHILYHAEAAKTDEFRALPPGAPAPQPGAPPDPNAPPPVPGPTQQAWIDHINLHYQDLMARQAAFAPPQQGPNQGQGEAGPIGAHDTSGSKKKTVESTASDPSAGRGNVGGLGAGGGEQQ